MTAVLSSREVRRLAEIAEQLGTGDPVLARRLQRHRCWLRGPRRPRAGLSWFPALCATLAAVALTCIGLVLLVDGLEHGQRGILAAGAVVLGLVPFAPVLVRWWCR